MQFSKRTDWPLTENPLTAAFAKKQAAGVAVLDLTESNPTRCSFSYLESSFVLAPENSNHSRYEPSARGLLEAREAVVGYYADHGVSMSADEIFLTSSTSEAYSFLFRLLLDPG